MSVGFRLRLGSGTFNKWISIFVFPFCYSRSVCVWGRWNWITFVLRHENLSFFYLHKQLLLFFAFLGCFRFWNDYSALDHLLPLRAALSVAHFACCFHPSLLHLNNFRWWWKNNFPSALHMHAISDHSSDLHQLHSRGFCTIFSAFIGLDGIKLSIRCILEKSRGVSDNLARWIWRD